MLAAEDGSVPMLVDLELRGRIAVVTLNRPERLNAVCFPLRSELMSVLARLNADVRPAFRDSDR